MSTGISVIKSFLRRGFRMVGDGCYAAVFESNQDPNLVYKVGNTACDPYLTYIQANIDSPSFPRVHKTYIDYDNDYYIVVMERLDPVPEHKHGTLPVNIRKQFTGEVSADTDMQPVIDLVTRLLDCCSDFKLDLHAGNIMMRGLVPVVTDPLAHEEIDDSFDLSLWMDSYGNALYTHMSA